MFVLLNIFFAQQKLLAMNAPQPPTTPTGTVTPAPSPPSTPAPTGTVTPATTPGSGTQGKYVSKYFGTKSFPDYIQELYKWTVAAGILLAVIMLMLAGYTYAISAGDVEKINNAKERIVGAVLGLLVLILAAVILSNLGVTSIN